MKEPEIYCPLCKWKPLFTSRWRCTPKLGGCGHVWNTFLTGGVCPQCAYQWEITACLSCKQFSLHKDWYHFPQDDSVGKSKQAEKETEHV